MAIYTRKTLKTSLIKTSLITDAFEYVAIEIINGSDKCIVISTYFPPDIDNYHFLGNILDEFSILNPKVIICGDLNINLLNHTTSKSFLETINNYNMHLANSNNATHYMPGKVPSLIDVLLVSNPRILNHYSQLFCPGFSYHDLIFTTANIETTHITESFSYRDFKRVNLTRLLNECSTLAWNLIYFT